MKSTLFLLMLCPSALNAMAPHANRQIALYATLKLQATQETVATQESYYHLHTNNTLELREQSLLSPTKSSVIKSYINESPGWPFSKLAHYTMHHNDETKEYLSRHYVTLIRLHQNQTFQGSFQCSKCFPKISGDEHWGMQTATTKDLPLGETSIVDYAFPYMLEIRIEHQPSDTTVTVPLALTTHDNDGN